MPADLQLSPNIYKASCALLRSTLGNCCVWFNPKGLKSENVTLGEPWINPWVSGTPWARSSRGNARDGAGPGPPPQRRSRARPSVPSQRLARPEPPGSNLTSGWFKLPGRFGRRIRRGVVFLSEDGGAQWCFCGREWRGVKPEEVGRGCERGGGWGDAAMASDGGRKQFWKRSGAKVPGRWEELRKVGVAGPCMEPGQGGRLCPSGFAVTPTPRSCPPGCPAQRDPAGPVSLRCRDRVLSVTARSRVPC